MSQDSTEDHVIYDASPAHSKQVPRDKFITATIQDTEYPPGHVTSHPLVRDKGIFASKPCLPILTREQRLTHLLTLAERYNVKPPSAEAVLQVKKEVKEGRLPKGCIPADSILLPGLRCGGLSNVPVLVRAGTFQVDADGYLLPTFCVPHAKDSKPIGKDQVRYKYCSLYHAKLRIRQYTQDDWDSEREGPIYASEIPESMLEPGWSTETLKSHLDTEWEPKQRPKAWKDGDIQDGMVKWQRPSDAQAKGKKRKAEEGEGEEEGEEEGGGGGGGGGGGEGHDGEGAKVRLVSRQKSAHNAEIARWANLTFELLTTLVNAGLAVPAFSFCDPSQCLRDYATTYNAEAYDAHIKTLKGEDETEDEASDKEASKATANARRDGQQAGLYTTARSTRTANARASQSRLPPPDPLKHVETETATIQARIDRLEQDKVAPEQDRVALEQENVRLQEQLAEARAEARAQREECQGIYQNTGHLFHQLSQTRMPTDELATGLHIAMNFYYEALAHGSALVEARDIEAFKRAHRYPQALQDIIDAYCNTPKTGDPDHESAMTSCSVGHAAASKAADNGEVSDNAQGIEFTTQPQTTAPVAISRQPRFPAYARELGDFTALRPPRPMPYGPSSDARDALHGQSTAASSTATKKRKRVRGA